MTTIILLLFDIVGLRYVPHDLLKISLIHQEKYCSYVKAFNFIKYYKKAVINIVQIV